MPSSPAAPLAAGASQGANTVSGVTDHEESGSLDGDMNMNMNETMTMAMDASILTASTQYNDELGKRQAEVRAALNDLFGDFPESGDDGHVEVHDGANGGTYTGHAHLSPQLQLAFAMDDGESISFDPLVGNDTDATAARTASAAAGRKEEYEKVQHQYQDEQYSQNELYSPIARDEDSSDGDSLSSFSLSLLGDMNLNTSTSSEASPQHSQTKAQTQAHPQYVEPHSKYAPSARHQAFQESLNHANDMAVKNLSSDQEVSTSDGAQIIHTTPIQHQHTTTIQESKVGVPMAPKGEENMEQDEIEEIRDLQQIKANLEEQITILKADQVLLSKSPTKYQVELESMRTVADQVQIEAKEKVRIVQLERDELRNQLEDALRNGHGGNGGLDSAYQRAFYSLLEQICLLEESGLRKDASYPMDRVVKDTMKIATESHALSPSSRELVNEPLLKQFSEMEHRVQNYVERLEKGCGSSNLIESILSEEAEVNDQENEDASKFYVSVGVDTEDLLSNVEIGVLSSSLTVEPSSSLHQTMSELQLENATLKGSNQHMKEQLGRYKQQLQMLRSSSTTHAHSGSSNHFLSPSISNSTFSANQNITDESYKELKQSNLKLRRQIEILSQSKHAVEEENTKVVQRCVDLENVAEDATRECERLHRLCVEAEAVEKERNDLLALQADHDEAMARQEEEHERYRTEMEAEVEAVQNKYYSLKETSGTLEMKLKSLSKKNASLESELGSTHLLVEQQQKDLSTLQSRLELEEKRPNHDEKITQQSKEMKRLTKERNELLGEIEKLQKSCQVVGSSSTNLEDECSRLRNLNSMIKAKIEITETDLAKTQKENISFAKELSSLRKESDATRNENVSLSDIKTDLEIKVKKLEDECSKHNSSLEKLENELNKVVALRIDLQKQNEVLSQELSSKEEALSCANQEIVNLSTKKDDVESQVDSLRKEVCSLKEQLSHLQPNNQQQDKRVVFDTEFSPINKSCRKWEEGCSAQRSLVGVQTPEASSFISNGWPLNNSILKTATSRQGASITPSRVGSIESMDDQLERIKGANERATYILKNISNLRSTTLKQSNKCTDIVAPNSDLRLAPILIKGTGMNTSRIEETEAFVNDILNSCGKQTLAN